MGAGRYDSNKGERRGASHGTRGACAPQRNFHRAPIAAEVIADLLVTIREEFYRGNNKAWFQERQKLVAALTWMAQWFRSRGVAPTLERYRAILREIITEARAHARVEIRSPALYLHKCIQDHIAHRGEGYYEEAKRLRGVTDVTLRKLTDSQKEARESAAGTTSLADVYAAAARRKPKERHAA